MTWLDRLWARLGGAGPTTDTLLDHASPEIQQQRRAGLLINLQSMEQLASGLGYTPPSPSASTFSTTVDTTRRVLGTVVPIAGAVMDSSPLTAWSTAWDRIARGNNNLPPESLFDPSQPPVVSALPWQDLHRHAEDHHAPQAVVRYLAERRDANPNVPHDSPLFVVDTRSRQWWAARILEPWGTLGPNAPTAHGTTPTTPPAPGERRAPAHHPPPAPGGVPQAPAITPPPPDDSGGFWSKILIGLGLAVVASKHSTPTLKQGNKRRG